MMKKLLLLLAVILLTATGTIAQNANRNGFFLELQGGAAFGEVLKYDAYNCEPMSKLKGGMVGGLDFGYRWATSTQFAIDAKVGILANLADFKNTHNLRIMPGLRWNSKDFGSKNMSAYISLNTGIGIGFFSYSTPVSIPIEVSAGLNFTKNFYGGLAFNYMFWTKGETIVDSQYYDRTNRIYTMIHDYPSVSLKLGYRF